MEIVNVEYNFVLGRTVNVSMRFIRYSSEIIGYSLLMRVTPYFCTIVSSFPVPWYGRSDIFMSKVFVSKASISFLCISIIPQINIDYQYSNYVYFVELCRYIPPFLKTSFKQTKNSILIYCFIKHTCWEMHRAWQYRVLQVLLGLG